MKSRRYHTSGLLALTLAMLSATLACSLATRLSGRDQSPTPLPSSGGLIAYAGSDGNIYTIDRSGGQRTAITTDAIPSNTPGGAGRIYEYPTWAPDGEHLAFVELSDSGLSGIHARLLNSALGSGDLVEAFSSDVYLPFYLYWSPDSRNISFLSNGTGEGDLVLHLAAADGSGSHIAGTGQPYYWDWSPDGNEIFIHTGGTAAENPKARLAFVTMKEPFPSQEISLPPASFQAPAWSPDGGTVAVAVETGSGAALVLQERDSGKQRRIAEMDGSAAFAWSPDGSRLAYALSSSVGPDFADKELYVVQPSQPGAKRLLTSGVIAGFFWSPDGGRLAVLKAALPGEGDNSLTALQVHPQISLALQVIDVDSGKVRNLSSFTPTDAFLNLLSFFDQYQRSITLWSPDSRELVIPAVNAQGGMGIYVIDAQGDGSKKIADGDLAFWSP